MTEPLRRPRVGLISLGCAKNLVDGEIMLGELARRGYELVDDLDGAETVIVNTCAFIDEAKQESIDTILEVAARKGQGRRSELLVAGCMVQPLRRGAARGRSRRSTASSGSTSCGDGRRRRRARRRAAAAGALAPGLRPHRARACSRPAATPTSRSPRAATTPAPSARSRSGAGASAAARSRAWWPRRGSSKQPGVARALPDRPGHHALRRGPRARPARPAAAGRGAARRHAIPWIRFLYAYPTTLDEELLRLMGSEQRFCLLPRHPAPAQPSATILPAMRRGGDAERYLRLLDRARELAPDIFLRTTFIVGFPGETEEHFAAPRSTSSSAARFDHVGAFAYSAGGGHAGGRARRTGCRRRSRAGATPAAAGGSEADRAGAPSALVGRRLEVLVEGVCDESEHLLQGRHHGMAPEIDGRLLINDGSRAGRHAASRSRSPTPTPTIWSGASRPHPAPIAHAPGARERAAADAGSTTCRMRPRLTVGAVRSRAET